MKNSEQNLITADFTKPRTEGTQGELGNVTMPGINQKDLTVGDVIEYQVDNNGEMCDIVIYARMDSINRGLGYISHDRVEADGGYYTFNGTRPNIVGFGRVTGTYGENTFLNVGDLSIDDVARTHTIKLGGNCYVVDTKRGKVTVGSLGDVDTGDIIVTRSHIRDMWEVVVFKQ